MEENENKNFPELPFTIINIFSFADSLSSDPLFSTITTLYILFLLYFPRIFLKIAFSPVLIITLTILLTLLRFGATQGNENSENNKNKDNNETKESNSTQAEKSESSHEDRNWVTCKDQNFIPYPRFEEKFVEWNVRAPLEVIYEAYEGEEGEEENEENKDLNSHGKVPARFVIERYPSLSLYYPESDSDSSSDSDYLAIGDWGSPESVCFRWEDEDREGLIEIALDGIDNDSHDYDNKRELDHLVENFHGEEENSLIEIDISPAKQAGKWRFSGDGD